MTHDPRIFTAFCALLAGCNHSKDSPISNPSVDASVATASSVTSRVDASLTLGSPPDAVVREEAKVLVDGVEESWRLEWRHPPLPMCMGSEAYTCPCAGFEFGEKGDLDLVREQPGAPEDRLPLGVLFEDRDAKLSRWSATDAEKGKLAVPSQASLQKRPLARAMKFGDYDHDGRATEFVLQIAAFSCGHATSVVVGVDKKNPKLHVFSSIEAPKDVLTFESRADWEKIRTSLPLTLVEVPCGDHGADEEESVHVAVDAAGLHASRSKKKCDVQSP